MGRATRVVLLCIKVSELAQIPCAFAKVSAALWRVSALLSAAYQNFGSPPARRNHPKPFGCGSPALSDFSLAPGFSPVFRAHGGSAASAACQRPAVEKTVETVFIFGALSTRLKPAEARLKPGANESASTLAID